ncbi:hypothetical protein BPTFM16_02845 [Altererythrobacter insulae]|nr:hypothetical protein BPTFM16_02845 [Altererythrobacter insulae]
MAFALNVVHRFLVQVGSEVRRSTFLGVSLYLYRLTYLVAWVVHHLSFGLDLSPHNNILLLALYYSLSLSS